MGSHTVIKKLGTRRYRKLSSRLDTALQTGKFEQAARYSASISAVASSDDALAILISAAQAYKEGKSKGWTPPSSEIVATGMKRAKEVSKVSIAPRRQGMVKTALSEAAERAKRGG